MLPLYFWEFCQLISCTPALTGELNRRIRTYPRPDTSVVHPSHKGQQSRWVLCHNNLAQRSRILVMVNKTRQREYFTEYNVLKSFIMLPLWVENGLLASYHGKGQHSLRIYFIPLAANYQLAS
jgi:hypothetical protein